MAGATSGVQLTKLGYGRYEVVAEVVLPRPREEVFAFFADARNLAALTPPWLGFTIVRIPEGPLEEGALIDYRLSLRGLPVKWRTRIAEWDPPNGFADDQLRGPYRSWYHEHRFEEVDGGAGTRVTDRVRYRVPVPLVAAPIVARDVRKIFAYRTAELARLFPAA